MSDIREICELSGLSQKQLADWLGVSRGLLFLIAKGKRKTPEKALFKVAVMVKYLREAKQHAKTGKVIFTEHAKLAELHKEKMDKHRKIADSLQRQMEKLQDSIPLMQSTQAMFDQIKAGGIPGYEMNYGDELLMEIIRLESKDPAKQLAELELLQDKIDTHLAYSELHQQRWEKYTNMM